MTRFEDDRYYPTTAPELRVVATRGTLAIWRHQGKGPAYTRFGHRVLYLGADLNRFLDQNRIEPTAA